MQRYSLVIIKPWRWYLPWIPPKFGVQEVEPVNHLWPDDSFCKSREAEEVEVMLDAVKGSLHQTDAELERSRASNREARFEAGVGDDTISILLDKLENLQDEYNELLNKQ